MSNRARTIIEVAPVELWREVFEYFDLFGLWYSFRGLNRRIDGILDHIPLHLHLSRRETYAWFMKNIHPTIAATNVANIRSLSLHASTEIEHFFSMYPLGSLVQLRRLSLTFIFSFNDPTFQFWNQVASLKHLQFLHIGYWGDGEHDNCIEEKEFIIRSIFNQHFCPALQSFSINTSGTQKCKPTIPSLIPTRRVTNLRYLSIDSLTFHDLTKLLPALKNIKCLRITYQLCKDEKFSGKPAEVHLSPLPQCLQLELKLDKELTFEHVEYLLTRTPNLKSLFLWGWCHLTDANKWEALLATHCPKLVKLDLICTSDVCEEIFDEAMEHFQDECRASSYWQQRKVTVTDEKDRSGHDYRTDLSVEFDLRKK